MKLKSEKNFFQPRARLLLQLGDKLIKNENIALLELIKNSYDADAKKVTVSLSNITDKGLGKIDIIDNGEGMDMEIIENVWLEPGSDYKEQLFKKRKRTKKYDRLPIGEKGIGRFGVHKLGNKIELISKKEGKNEVVVSIDWNEFSKNKYLKDARFEVYERTSPEYFKRSRTGTRIVITDLRSSWDRKMVRDFYKSVFTLNSPFKKAGTFKVDIDIDDTSSLQNLPQWSDIQKFSLWHFKCKIEGSEIIEFKYEFTPWDSMTGIPSKEVTHSDEFIINRSTLVIPKEKGKKKKSEEVLNLSRNYGTDNEPLTIGPLAFEGYLFDRDKTTLELNEQAGVALLKQYLDEQGGIRVYRDNIRINEYGEKGNDWLNLDIRRVNVPAKKVSNNLILGVVDLDSEQSSALIEKTNREGFIENEAFNDFGTALRYVLNLVEVLRKSDKDLIREKYNPTEAEEPVLHHLGELKELVESRIDNSILKDEINTHLVKIEEDYNRINEILLTSAGVGLTMGVGIHEVQKVISELNEIVKSETVPETILNLISHLDELIENYGELFVQSKREDHEIIRLIDGALFNLSYRLRAHNVIIDHRYRNFTELKTINCSKRLLLGTIVNIVDNSIYWLNRKEKNLNKTDEGFEKRILIDFVKNRDDGMLEILIADNAVGFGLPTDQITKPFITDKDDGLGMGLGLHIASEVMKIHDGEICFPDKANYDLPDNYKYGALVVLRLKA